VRSPRNWCASQQGHAIEIQEVPEPLQPTVEGDLHRVARHVHECCREPGEQFLEFQPLRKGMLRTSALFDQGGHA
jgi:hypothetical protein